MVHDTTPPAGLEAPEGAESPVRGPVKLDILSRLGGIDLMADVSIIVEGVPEGGQLSTGRNNWDGTWSLTPIHLTRLKFIPPPIGPDQYDLTIRVVTIDTDGYGVATTAALFDLAVSAFADGSADEHDSDYDALSALSEAGAASTSPASDAQALARARSCQSSMVTDQGSAGFAGSK